MTVKEHLGELTDTDIGFLKVMARVDLKSCGLTSLEGGFIKTTVPCMCIMNFKGSSVWTGEDGKECLILGNTPLQCKALFVENDSDMLYHRTWVGSSVNWAVA